MENELPQGVPRRGPVVRLTESRSPVAWSKTRRVAGDHVCFRALPAGEPAEGRAFHARSVKETRCM